MGIPTFHIGVISDIWALLVIIGLSGCSLGVLVALLWLLVFSWGYLGVGAGQIVGIPDVVARLAVPGML